MTETEQMPLVYIQLCHLLEQLIERLVTMGHHQISLPWEVVVQIRYDLNSYVGFTCRKKITLMVSFW